MLFEIVKVWLDGIPTTIQNIDSKCVVVVVFVIVIALAASHVDG